MTVYRSYTCPHFAQEKDFTIASPSINHSNSVRQPPVSASVRNANRYLSVCGTGVCPMAGRGAGGFVSIHQFVLDGASGFGAPWEATCVLLSPGDRGAPFGDHFLQKSPFFLARHRIEMRTARYRMRVFWAMPRGSHRAGQLLFLLSMSHLLLEAGEDGLKESVPYQINDDLPGVCAGTLQRTGNVCLTGSCSPAGMSR